MSLKIKQEQSHVLPRVIIDEEAQQKGWSIDGQGLAEKMAQDYGMSAQQITDTTVLVSGDNHIFYRGSEIPKPIDRLLRGKRPANEGSGSVIRINTRLRGQERPPEKVNKTLAHELEHTAQDARKDSNRIVGNAIIWGFALAGSVSGNILTGKNIAWRLVGTILGGMAGQQIGYTLSPHEIQARRKTQEGELSVIRRSAELESSSMPSRLVRG